MDEVGVKESTGSPLAEWVTKEIAKFDQHPQTTEVMLWLYLIESQRRMTRALDDPHPDSIQWNADVQIANLSGMCAFLLDQLHQCDPGQAADVAWTLYDWDTDGEPCAQWVGEQIADRGVIMPPTPAAERHDLAALEHERHPGGGGR